MEYSVGKTGRIIAARLFEGEDLYESVETLAKKENIKSAAVLITGGFRKANVVVGPKTETPKITADFKDFAGAGKGSIGKCGFLGLKTCFMGGYLWHELFFGSW